MARDGISPSTSVNHIIVILWLAALGISMLFVVARSSHQTNHLTTLLSLSSQSSIKNVYKIAHLPFAKEPARQQLISAGDADRLVLPSVLPQDRSGAPLGWPLHTVAGAAAIAIFTVLSLVIRAQRRSRHILLSPLTSLLEQPPAHQGAPAHVSFAALVIAFGKVRESGPPAFWRPSPANGSEWPDATYDPDLPTMYYLPGIDGTGVAAQQQLGKLAMKFNLWSLTIPVADRTPLTGLVDLVVDFIEQEAAARDSPGPLRPVYLLGESFGGALALAVAVKCRRVNRVVLVNPSTSFSRTVWPTVGPVLTRTPEAAYPLVALLLGPILANPLSLLLAGIDSAAKPAAQFQQLRDRVVAGLPAFREIASVLPPATLDHKLQLLRESCDLLTDSQLRKVTARVLLFGSDLDLLLPSASEVRQLARRLPMAEARVLRLRSHALLQEAGVDLMAMLEDEGFYTKTLVLSGPADAPVTVELPTRRETELATRRLGVDLLESLVSPVYLSADREGRVRRGLGGVEWGRRPILLVGNHQTLSPDLGILIKQLLLKEGVLARGLSHPAVTGNGDSGDGGRSGSQRSQGDEGVGAMGSTFRRFGAVTVSGRSLYDVLANGEVALLYPGGVREAYKRKGEEYRLIWPDRPEFVRIAARFGATIIPLSAIGTDDGVEVLLDGEDLRSIPFLGESLRRRSREIPAARPGALHETERFISPLVVPKLGDSRRFYFLFGQPIDTDPSMDRAACAAVYQDVRGAVGSGIDWLLEQRRQDPYQSFPPRALYEAAWGKQAPSFPIPEEGVMLPWAADKPDPNPDATSRGAPPASAEEPSLPDDSLP